MISMLIAVWDLLYSSLVCLSKGIIGLVIVVTAIAIPIGIAGVIWKGFCIIFAFEFDWWIPMIALVLSVCLIVTGEGGE